MRPRASLEPAVCVYQPEPESSVEKVILSLGTACVSLS